MGKTILHIGFHKTATTTLQQQFFPACEGINLLTTQNTVLKKFIALVTKTDPAYFNSSKAYSLIADCLSDDMPNIISNESLSSLPYSGAIEAGLDHRTPILHNLKRVFPEAKVILIIRRQDGFAKSLYRQYLKSGGTKSIKRFYGMESVDKPAIVGINRFLYKKYIDAVFDAFPSNVLLMPFEKFVNDQQGFLKEITDFIGIDMPDVELKRENAAVLSPFMLELTRYMNFGFRSLLNPAGMIPGFMINKHGRKRRQSPVQYMHDHWPAKRKIVGPNDVIAQRILQQVREENRQLDGVYSLNLAQYGYY